MLFGVVFGVGKIYEMFVEGWWMFDEGYDVVIVIVEMYECVVIRV